MTLLLLCFFCVFALYRVDFGSGFKHYKLSTQSELWRLSSTNSASAADLLSPDEYNSDIYASTPSTTVSAHRHGSTQDDINHSIIKL